MIKIVPNTIKNMDLSFHGLFLFLKINFFSSNIVKKTCPSKLFHFPKCLLWPSKYSIIRLDKQSKIILKGTLRLIRKDFIFKGINTVIKAENKSCMYVNRDFLMFPGAQIHIMNNGKLILGGGFINESSQIIVSQEVTIGKNCAIACEVIICDYDFHNVDMNKPKSKPIHIGDNVWIGRRAMILKGCCIGEGSVIAAGSIVTKDVPPHTLVAGNPARIIRNNVNWIM